MEQGTKEKTESDKTLANLFSDHFVYSIFPGIYKEDTPAFIAFTNKILQTFYFYILRNHL